jgi:hypothetical protein
MLRHFKAYISRIKKCTFVLIIVNINKDENKSLISNQSSLRNYSPPPHTHTHTSKKNVLKLDRE